LKANESPIRNKGVDARIRHPSDTPREVFYVEGLEDGIRSGGELTVS
jgi:hypothetical protein